MKKPTTKYRRGRTCVFLLHVHLVFVTKYRRKAITGQVLHSMKRIFDSVCNDFDATLVECNGERDHVHLLVNYPPKISLSSLVNSLKGVSSRLIKKKKFAEIESSLWGQSLWSPSYFAASCGGAPLSIVERYVRALDPIDSELSSRT